MIRVHPLKNPLVFRDPVILDIPASLQRRIDGIWDSATGDNPALHDGAILAALPIEEGALTPTRLSYRHVIAMRTDPQIRRALDIHPLAVSGVLRCPEGFVLGRRGGSVSEGRSLWELVPSGGLEAKETTSAPDPAAQVLCELKEEIGLDHDDVVSAPALGLLINDQTGTIDIVLPLTTALPAETICHRHETIGSEEYDVLTITENPLDTWDDKAILEETRLILASFYP